MMLGRLRSFATRYRKPLLGVGVVGAAGLALATRKRGGGGEGGDAPTSDPARASSPAQQVAYDSIATDVNRSLSPQIDSLQQQITGLRERNADLRKVVRGVRGRVERQNKRITKIERKPAPAKKPPAKKPPERTHLPSKLRPAAALAKRGAQR